LNTLANFVVLLWTEFNVTSLNQAPSSGMDEFSFSCP
jgi:hypothetical protein